MPRAFLPHAFLPHAFFERLGALSRAMAVLGTLVLAAVTLAVIFDVVVRNLGLRPPLWTVPLTEFGLLYATLLGTPLLVRTKGHIMVDVFVSHLAGRPQLWMGRAVAFVSFLAFAYLGIIAFDEMVLKLRSGEFQIRSIEVPVWLIYLPMAAAFLVGALEYCRFPFEDNLLKRGAELPDSL
ncbi:MAG: TRAP transporter small permease [Betaproteobacteria bacterium]|nr:TRAP transporter small permease [Betaproteobacteria bacterium]